LDVARTAVDSQCVRFLRTLGIFAAEGLVGWVATKTLDASIMNPLTHDLLIGGVWLALIVMGGGWLIARELRLGREVHSPSVPAAATAARPMHLGWQGLRDELTRQRDVVREHYAELETLVGPRPASLASNAQSLPAENRVFVGPSVTVAYLTSLFESRTEVQGNELVRPFLGHWLRVSGTFADLSDGGSDHKLIVTFQLDMERPFPRVLLWFESQWRDRLLILTAGTPITVIGQIRSVERNWVTLERCELEDPAQAAR